MKISKKNMKAFMKDAERLFLDNEFRRTVTTDKYHYRYEWVKDTEYGVLYGNPDPGGDVGVVSIFFMFEDIDRSREIHGNLHNGKCNIHEYGVESALNELKRFFKII